MRALTAAIVLLGLLQSCSSQGHWKYNQVGSGSVSLSGSSRLSYLSSNPEQGIQLEIFQTNDTTKGFLTVRTQSIPQSLHDPKEALFSLIIEDKNLPCSGTRHEGGHRLLLNNDTLLLIVEALLQGKSVGIRIGGYRDTLDSTGFLKQYKRCKPIPCTGNEI